MCFTPKAYNQDPSFGQQHFDTGIEAFGRRIVGEPDAFPPNFLEIFLQSNLTAPGGGCRPVCVRMMVLLRQGL